MNKTYLATGLLLVTTTPVLADNNACRQALVDAEQASRTAQEALLVAAAKNQPPVMDESLDRLTASTLRAREACDAQAAAQDSGALSDFLPDFDSDADESEKKPATRRRTPAERVHGRY